MPQYFRYSRWDGSQQIFDVDQDQLLEKLSKDVLEHGDVNRALRNLFRRGLNQGQEQRTMGLRDLMERLRQQRQQNLQQNNLDSVMDQLREQLKEIEEMERQGIDRRLEEAQQRLQEASPEQQEQMQKPMEMLQNRAQKNQEALNNLPESVGGQIQQLGQYDFMDPQAQQKFQELLDSLKGQMMNNYFQGMQQALQQMSPEQMEGLKQMLRDLSQMLRDRAEGKAPNFQGFMEKYGGLFGDPPPSNLDELMEQIQQRMAQAQSLMESLSPEQQKELQGMLDSLMDDETMDELAELGRLMGRMMPPDELAQRYPFTGDKD
ncbi:MAG: VWA domain-containing protein, partial [Dehalococcoidia bacterium]|nr:VWA domain-containing protein [Dehalococcoidia bacterium]